MNTPENRGRAIGRCPDARALLPAFVENELPAAEQIRVRDHLETCADCRREEAAFRSALGALTVSPKPAHGNLYAGLSAKIDALEQKPVFRPRQLRWAGAAACLVLAVGVGATVATRQYFGKPKETAQAVTPAPTPAQPAVQRVRPKTVPPAVPTEPGPDTKEFKAISLPDETAPRERSADAGIDYSRADAYRSSDASGKGFRDVRARDGSSAADIEKRLRADQHATLGGDPAPGPDPRPAVPKNMANGNASDNAKPDDSKEIAAQPATIPSVPNVKVVVPEKEQRQKDGEIVVKSRRTTGYDGHGKLKLIKLRLNGEPVSPDPSDKDKDTQKDDHSQNGVKDGGK